MIGQLPPVYANAITPFALPGRQPVGQETVDLKNSTFKSLEEAAESGYLQNRRLPDEHPDYPDEQRSPKRSRSPADNTEGDKEAALKREAQQQQDLEDREIIDVLAARDREVRAHEQAHASVGGQYAGSPVYTYERGPDGVAYAVGGEVSISTAAIPGDPEATLAKARQVRRAAQAPAEMSQQDHLVAATAARMEMEALTQIMIRETEKVAGPGQSPSSSAINGEESEESSSLAPAVDAKEEQARKALAESAHQQWLALNRRFHDMGVWGNSKPPPGSFLDSRV
jgi:hypothetical protein